MALPLSGPIALSAVGTEIKKPLLTAVDFNSLDVRKLAYKLTDKSAISAFDLYGRAFGSGLGYALQDFTDVINTPTTSVVYSNLVLINGISSSPVTMAIFSNSTANYRVNGGAWTDKNTLATVRDGDTVELNVVASSLYSTSTSVDVNIGGTIKTWTSTTGIAGAAKWYRFATVWNSISIIQGFSLTEVAETAVTAGYPIYGLSNLITGITLEPQYSTASTQTKFFKLQGTGTEIMSLPIFSVTYSLWRMIRHPCTASSTVVGTVKYATSFVSGTANPNYVTYNTSEQQVNYAGFLINGTRYGVRMESSAASPVGTPSYGAAQTLRLFPV